ncbi:MAG: hypothetical protein ACI935_003878, partial [Moritella dasanensis]
SGPSVFASSAITAIDEKDANSARVKIPFFIIYSVGHYLLNRIFL